MPKFIPLIVISFLLQGCVLFKKPEKPQEPAPLPKVETQQINIDSKILELCAKLPEQVVINSFEDVVAVYGELVTNYVTCANRQADSVKLLKKIGNIK